MGEKFNYRCPSCGFAAQCSHGRDRGFRIAVEAMFCSECKSLKNIHTGDYVKDENAEKLVSVQPICNTCNKSSNLKIWDGTTCPICNHEPMQYQIYSICWD